MIEGKQNILSWFENTGFPYWSLFHQGKTDSGNWVAKSSDSEAATVKSAYDDLNKHLRLLSRGKFTLVAGAKPGITAKGTYRTDIEISMAETLPSTAPATVGAIPDGYISKTEIAGIVSGEITKYRQEQELEALKAKVVQLETENRELEKEANDGWNKFIGAINPFLPQLVNQMLPQVAGIPQTLPPMPTTNETEELRELTPQEADRLQNAINIFYEASPGEWLIILEKMAAKVQLNPAILNQLKAFL